MQVHGFHHHACQYSTPNPRGKRDDENKSEIRGKTEKSCYHVVKDMIPTDAIIKKLNNDIVVQWGILLLFAGRRGKIKNLD